MKYPLIFLSLLLLTACASTSHALSDAEQELGYDKSSREYQDGVKEARVNILKNNLELRAYGLIIDLPREVNEDPRIKENQDAIERKYSEILLQHNVTVVETGCVVDSINRVMGYQDTVSQEISTRYGPDFFERARTQAKAAIEGAP